MAVKDSTIKYKNCKFDFENGLVIEYTKDDVFEHKLEDVFKDCHFEQNELFFDITIKETSIIAPAEVDGEEV